MTKISIAMCTYFGERYLEQQLASIREQTHQPHEVIICDDGSTDATHQIIQQWQSNSSFPVKILYNEKRLGYAANFEKALQHCCGDWVAFCDQDDVWFPQKLAQVRAVCDPQFGFILHDACLAQDDPKISLWDHCGLSRYGLKTKSGLQNLLKTNVAFGNSMIVRKDAIPAEAFPFYRSHDGWLAHVIALNQPVYFLDEPLLFYRQHEGQILPHRMEKPSLVQKLGDLRNSYTVMKDEIEFLHQVTMRMGAHALLEQKTRHLEHRVALSQGKGSLLRASRDLRLGYYRHFSNGLKGFAKDIAAQIFP